MTTSSMMNIDTANAPPKTRLIFDVSSPTMMLEDDPVGRAGKYIKDPIHGHIYMPQEVVEFIDTPQFQRLRDLKQLGSCYFIFPGATHNRFEHSIGVSHLAGQLVDRFRRSQPNLEISEVDALCVRLAGLCHDLGHGPFSHIFDSEFIPRAKPGSDWTHEKASEMMLDYLWEDNEFAVDLSSNDIQFIKELIAGQPRSKHERSERGFLYEIVANKRNSVDVDKLDYIARDCYNLDFKSGYESDRLLKNCRVINNEICYDQKEVYNIYELFHTRYSLFKRVYTHRVGKAIEYMIVDALLAAEPYLHLSEKIEDPRQYLHLTDSIVKEIERSTSDDLATSRSILDRLRRRQLYKFVDQKIIPSDNAEAVARAKQLLTPAHIIQNVAPGVELKETDFVIEWLKINYAMKDRNPVDSTRFYSKYHDNSSFHITQNQVSYLVPEIYEELDIRIFAKDTSKMKEIQESFRKCLAEIERQFQFANQLHYRIMAAESEDEHAGNDVIVNGMMAMDEGVSPGRALNTADSTVDSVTAATTTAITTTTDTTSMATIPPLPSTESLERSLSNTSSTSTSSTSSALSSLTATPRKSSTTSTFTTPMNKNPFIVPSSATKSSRKNSETSSPTKLVNWSPNAALTIPEGYDARSGSPKKKKMKL